VAEAGIGDRMYPAEWHRIYSGKTGESARRILPPLLQRFSVTSMVEIGCGNAHWSQAALDNGVGDILAIDGPWNNRSALLVEQVNFRGADLSQPLELDRRFDLAVCLEVAEHLPDSSASRLVRSICDAADVVLFGAAIPMQGGPGHINERWPSYWRGLFEQHGYAAFDLVRPSHWEDREIHYWYRQNCFVYVSKANVLATNYAVQAPSGPVLPLFDAVHPEKFEEVAGYRSIAGKRLMRAFPGWLARRLRDKITGLG